MDKIMLQKYMTMYKAYRKFSKNVVAKEYQLIGRVSNETSEMQRKIHNLMMDSAKKLVISHYSDSRRFAEKGSPESVLIAHLVTKLKPWTAEC